MKVFVYFNLHKKCFSVKALEGPNKGRVVAHRRDILLTNVSFKVSEAGRQRVLREKRKNVHAGVVGWWSPHTEHDTQSMTTAVTYNPYKVSSFVYADYSQPIYAAPAALLVDKKIYI